MGFSPNIISDLQQIWYWDFMQHAFEAGTAIAIAAGIVGYFVVLRRSTFAAHALSHIGFAGAAGSVVLGSIPALANTFISNPVSGLLVFTTVGGIAMTALGPRASHRDLQIGIVLAFMLGLGVLFLNLYTGYASEAYSILFGEIVGVSTEGVELAVAASILVLVVVGIIYRPLLFASLDEDVAQAKGLPMNLLGMTFMLLVAVTVSFAVQVVGVLLIFSLMVTPAASATHLAKRPRSVLLISVGIAVATTWLGLFISYFTLFPVSFYITTTSFVVYLLVRALHHKIRGPAGPREVSWWQRLAGRGSR
jgi:zinc/manganese transport system permease protein